MYLITLILKPRIQIHCLQILISQRPYPIPFSKYAEFKEQKSKFQRKPIEREKSEDISEYKTQDWKQFFRIVTTNIHKLETCSYKIKVKLTIAAHNSFVVHTTSNTGLNNACYSSSM